AGNPLWGGPPLDIWYASSHLMYWRTSQQDAGGSNVASILKEAFFLPPTIATGISPAGVYVGPDFTWQLRSLLELLLEELLDEELLLDEDEELELLLELDDELLELLDELLESELLLNDEELDSLELD